MQIVGVQFDIAWEQPSKNWQRVRELLEQSAPRPGALIVLPEMFATGFSMNLAKTAEGEALGAESFVGDLAKQFQATVLAGVVGPMEASGQASNEAIAIDANGRTLVRYRKMQPFTPAGEHLHYAAGETHQTFSWQGLRIAPFICYDLRFPEIFRPAAGDGAELLVVVANWPSLRSEHWVRLLQARAIENQAFVMGVNRCGSDPQLHYDGRSAAFDPLGQCLFEADSREQVVVAEIEPELVRRWRSQFPALSDRRQ